MSAADVVAAARRLEAVGGALALEDAAGRVLGEELALRVEREHGGLDLPEWLKNVADHAAERLDDADGTTSRLLLHAIVSTGTDRAAKTANVRLEKQKRTTAAAAFADRYPWSVNVSPARPTSGALSAVDAYGSRYLLVAPFQTPGHESSAHWYAWDIDLCDTQRVVGAAAFTDPDDALVEWKQAVGATTTANSVLSTITEPTTIRELLDDCLMREMVGGSVMGDERADLLSEHFRMRSRAHHLSRSLPGHRSNPHATMHWRAYASANADQVINEFEGWFRERHPGDGFDEDSATDLIVEWLGAGPAFASLSCSPHRVRAMASFVWDSYQDDVAASISTLLPEWVTWCAAKTGLAEALTERSLAEARQTTATTRATRGLDRTGVPRIAE